MPDLLDLRASLHAFLNHLWLEPSARLPERLSVHLDADVLWDVAHPVNRLQGIAAVQKGFVEPLRAALTQARRRDEIFIGGPNRRAEGGYWLASLCHYVGQFDAELFSVPPSGHLVFLRSGEFYRIEPNGRISQAKIIIDLVDLMRQAGCFPFEQRLGTEMLFPTPATQDGVLPPPEQGDGERTLDLCEAMLADLRDFDPKTFVSKGQTGKQGYWDENMLWYGPGGIGSNTRWAGFEKDHRIPFLTAFPDRVGGDHYCRIGEGNYAAVGGWPSMTMTHRGAYLGVPATGKALTLRVMDFYRCAGAKIQENWVLLDYLDLFAQMGVDLLARARSQRGND